MQPPSCPSASPARACYSGKQQTIPTSRENHLQRVVGTAGYGIDILRISKFSRTIGFEHCLWTKTAEKHSVYYHLRWACFNRNLFSPGAFMGFLAASPIRANSVSSLRSQPQWPSAVPKGRFKGRQDACPRFAAPGREPSSARLSRVNTVHERHPGALGTVSGRPRHNLSKILLHVDGEPDIVERVLNVRKSTGSVVV